MNYLYFVHNDVTDSQLTGNRIIAHVCTETGIWSGQKSNALARKWPQARRAYRQWYLDRQRNNFALGCVQFVNVHEEDSDDMIRIANMIARTDIKRPVVYRAVRRCLQTVARKAIKIQASVHLSNLMDDHAEFWPDIELIVYNTLCTAQIPVYVHDSGPRQERPPWSQPTENPTDWLPLDSRN